jgi:hypothetical protein
LQLTSLSQNLALRSKTRRPMGSFLFPATIY